MGDGGTLPLAQITGQMGMEACSDSLLMTVMKLAVNLSKEAVSYHRRSMGPEGQARDGSRCSLNLQPGPDLAEFWSCAAVRSREKSAMGFQSRALNPPSRPALGHEILMLR